MFLDNFKIAFNSIFSNKARSFLTVLGVIIGVGSVVKKPVVVEINGMDTIAIKPMMYLTISHDHRLIDGMLGGKFLNSVKQRLENFDFSNI